MRLLPFPLLSRFSFKVPTLNFPRVYYKAVYGMCHLMKLSTECHYSFYPWYGRFSHVNYKSSNMECQMLKCKLLNLWHDAMRLLPFPLLSRFSFKVPTLNFPRVYYKAVYGMCHLMKLSTECHYSFYPWYGRFSHVNYKSSNMECQMLKCKLLNLWLTWRSWCREDCHQKGLSLLIWDALPDESLRPVGTWDGAVHPV